jgi:hypothetical protein
LQTHALLNHLSDAGARVGTRVRNEGAVVIADSSLASATCVEKCLLVIQTRL